MTCYLDYNASAPLLKEAKEASVIALDLVGNPSSVHKKGRASRYFIEKARKKVASLVGMEADNIIFTSGATEANNIALLNSKVFTSAIEHESVTEQLEISYIKTDKLGYMCLDDLNFKLSEYIGAKENNNNPIVSMMLANNETGIIQPVNKVAEIAHKYGAKFHCDAVQAAGRIQIDMKKLDCDMMTLSSHKIGGPKGAGALVFNSSSLLNPIFRGGGQERNFRSGTEPIISIVGFGVAAEHAQNLPLSKVNNLRILLEQKLKESFQNIYIVGENLKRLPNTTMFSLVGVASDTLVIALDLEGFEVSTGSACSSGKIGPNRVLEAMGIKNNISESAIRVSLGLHNDRKDIDNFIKTLNLVNNRFSIRKKQRI